MLVVIARIEAKQEAVDRLPAVPMELAGSLRGLVDGPVALGTFDEVAGKL